MLLKQNPTSNLAEELDQHHLSTYLNKKLARSSQKKIIKHYTHLFQVLFEGLPNPGECWRAAFTTDSYTSPTVNRPDCKIFTTQVNWGALVRLSLFINVALSVCSKACGSVCVSMLSHGWLINTQTGSGAAVLELGFYHCGADTHAANVFTRPRSVCVLKGVCVCVRMCV